MSAVVTPTTGVDCGVDHDHPLSLVEDIGDSRQVMECTNGCGEFILEAGDELVPIGEPTDGAVQC
jgi:hypothetical protein